MPLHIADINMGRGLCPSAGAIRHLLRYKLYIPSPAYTYSFQFKGNFSSENKFWLSSSALRCPSGFLSGFGITSDISLAQQSLSYRQLSSSSSSSSDSCPDSSNVVLLKSEKELNTALKNAQEESSPSIFYFTAVWCGPCRQVSPVVEELSKQYPNVAVYKVDIDQEGLGKTLTTLKIFSVPTFHFYQGGERKSQLVGADIAGLRHTIGTLYN